MGIIAERGRESPLQIIDILKFAATAHARREIVSRLVDEPLWRYWADRSSEYQVFWGRNGRVDQVFGTPEVRASNSGDKECA